jgi:tRNA dimethylallyltransferase
MDELFELKTPVLSPPYIKISLEPSERALLHRRIEDRFAEMMRSGFLEEVAALRNRGDLHLELPALRAVGYRQLWRHLDGVDGLEESIEKGMAATRQFAKRQLTWLRSETRVLRLDPDDAQLLDKVLHAVRCGSPENAC